MDTPFADTALRLHYDALFIDGAWVAPLDGGTESVINPATEAVIGQAPLGSAADCRHAIGAARRAFDDGAWPRLTGTARAAVLQRLAGLVKAQHGDIIELMRLEIGVTRAEAQFQYQLAMVQISKFIELAERNTVKSLPILISPTPSGGKTLGGAITARDPIGVVACITPVQFGLSARHAEGGAGNGGR